jgi:hypothetical protein
MPTRFYTAALIAALALPVVAQGHDTSPVPDGEHMVAAGAVPRDVQRALGGDVTPLANGLYAVDTKGFDYTTHGPDSKLAEEPQSPLTPGAPERAPHCADNPGSDYFQQVLYGYPANGANQLVANRASLRAQIRRNNSLLNRDAQASGGPEADFRVLCDADGQIKISAFPVTGGSTASFGNVVNSAQAAGFTNSRVDYTIFYDGTSSSACGVGNIAFDESPGVGNANNTGLDYGMTYRGCWFSRTPIHENAHNQGAAQPGAPNSTGTGWHCNERNDILCYVDGGSQNQSLIDCPLGPPAGGGFHYDCNWNTYFDAAPEPGEWLATHWNIGSTVNRFIVFANSATPPETTIDSGVSGLTTDPNPAFTFSANEPGASFECSLQPTGSSPSFAACTSPRSYNALTDGTYDFRVRARDGGSNADPTPALDTFTLDTAPPETTIDSGPEGSVSTTRPQFTFSSNESGATFRCSVDGAAFAPCVSPFDFDAAQGAHMFAVRSVDRVGRTDATPASRAFAVDSVAPDTQLTKKPKAVTKSKRKPTLTFDFEASESGATFQCRLDGGAFSRCSSPFSLKKVRFGRHVFEVRSVDAVQNTDASAATYSFKVKRKHKRR